MRLAYVNPQSYHGLAKYDAGFLRGMSESGFEGEIRFYCSDLLDQPIPDTTEVIAVFKYNRKRVAIARLLSYVTSMLRILITAFARPADVYHFQWFKFPPVDLLFVIALRKFARARVVYTAHNVVPHGTEERRHRYLGRLYRTVDRIIVHNASTADEISRRFSIKQDKFSVLLHGTISLEAKGTPRHRDPVSRFVASHDICFLFLGRGSRYKGLDILLQAWPQVCVGRDRSVGLIVMGAVDQELKAIARRVASESGSTLLLVDDYVPEADLFHAVQLCDVVVLPYRHISQSGALLSVLGLGVPVLVSALPGLLEPFDVAPVGWRFDGTEAGLVSQLGFLVDHPETVSSVRDNHQGWEAIKRAYDWKAIARSNATLYRNLLTTSA